MDETAIREPIDRPAGGCPKCQVKCTCEEGLAVRTVEGKSP